MTDPASVADDRDKLTHNHIPESLVAKGRDSGGNIVLGEIRYQHRQRDQYGNLLPDPPRFGDLLTPALGDLRVKDWHKLPPMGDKTTARYIAEIAHLPEVVKATEKAHKVDTRWKAIHSDYRKAVADRDDWIRIRRERDATLGLPDRMLAALQINLRGGRLPPAEDDGRHYLKLPVDRF